MSKSSHPYFIPNGDSREDTAVLLVGTADEAGIDQRGIQAVPGGFNITPEVARAVYGDEFVADQDETQDDSPEQVLTGQVPVSGNPDPETEPEDEDGLSEEIAPYDEWEYPTLKTEVANRGLDVEDQKKDTLVAALIQDDESDDSTTD